MPEPESYTEQPSTIESSEFVSYIIRSWIEASALARRIKASLLMIVWSQEEIPLLENFISLLTDIWVQIRPFVQNTGGITDTFKERFNAWEEYVKKPGLFDEDDTTSKIFDFYGVIGEALYFLGITRIETGGKT